LNGGIFEENLLFNSAFVDLTNVENNSKSEKDKVIEDIKNVVIEIAGVSKENIVVYG
jgi:phenylpyruvate tautomerase PptA (4-oxalocrotonate tautomerase family)